LRILPRRLFSYPSVAVRRLERGDGDATLAVLSIDGLVCDVCAARAQRALAGLPGATAAEVDLEAGAASVTFAGQAPSEEALSEAVEGVVLLRPARRRLARLRGERPR
jgi:copper chaperone CopZ